MQQQLVLFICLYFLVMLLGCIAAEIEITVSTGTALLASSVDDFKVTAYNVQGIEVLLGVISSPSGVEALRQDNTPFSTDGVVRVVIEHENSLLQDGWQVEELRVGGALFLTETGGASGQWIDGDSQAWERVSTPVPQTSDPQTSTPQTSDPLPTEETAAPHTSTPQASIPPTSAPQTSAPKTTTPQTSIPQTSAPKTPTPQTSIPQTSAPFSPQTSAPKTTTPQTSIPQTSAPQTSAPKTSTPQTTDPLPIEETSIPPTSAPQTSPPKTATPQTSAPETPTAQTSAPLPTEETSAPHTSTPQTSIPQTYTPKTTAAPAPPPETDGPYAATGAPFTAPTQTPHPSSTPTPPANLTERPVTPTEGPPESSAAPPTAEIAPTVSTDSGLPGSGGRGVMVAASSAALGSVVGGGVGPASRLALAAEGCRMAGDDVKEEELPLLFHPTQPLGSLTGVVAADAVAGNLLVVVIVALCSRFLVALVTSFATEQQLKKFETTDVGGLLRVPSAPLFVFQLLYQGSSYAALLLLTRPERWWHVVLGILALAGCAVVPVLILRELKYGMPISASYRSDLLTCDHTALRIMLGPGEWASYFDTDHWVQRYSSVVRAYHKAWVRFLGVEFASAFALAATAVLRPENAIGCGHVRVFQSIIPLVNFCLIIRLSPYCRPRDNVTIAAAACFEAMGLFSGALRFYSGGGPTTFSTALFIGAAALLVLKLLCDVASEGYVLFTGRRDRVQQALWTETRECNTMSGDVAALPPPPTPYHQALSSPPATLPNLSTSISPSPNVVTLEDLGVDDHTESPIPSSSHYVSVVSC